MKILAIETSCDETAAAVIFDGKVKSNIIASQADLHRKYGGVVPEVAAREHITAIIPTINLALKTARVELRDIDLIAVTRGPGLATSLMVGVDTAKALGEALNIPVLPVNHLEAHIYANFVRENPESKSQIPKFPAIALIVSGGHTMLVHMKGHGQYRIIGETVDDAAGEAFDKTAKLLGLPYPGGPHLSRLAESGNGRAFDLPRPMIKSDNFEFSFSGLKTAVLYKVHELGLVSASGEAAWRSGPKKGLPRRLSASSQMHRNLAASVQQAIVDVLMAKLEKAIIRFKPKTIMLGGGVAANKLLRQRFKSLGSRHKLRVSIPKFEYCTDNAGMIGLAAYYKTKKVTVKSQKFRNNFTVDPNLTLK